MSPPPKKILATPMEEANATWIITRFFFCRLMTEEKSNSLIYETFHIFVFFAPNPRPISQVFLKRPYDSNLYYVATGVWDSVKWSEMGEMDNKIAIRWRTDWNPPANSCRPNYILLTYSNAAQPDTFSEENIVCMQSFIYSRYYFSVASQKIQV